MRLPSRNSFGWYLVLFAGLYAGFGVMSFVSSRRRSNGYGCRRESNGFMPGLSGTPGPPGVGPGVGQGDKPYAA